MITNGTEIFDATERKKAHLYAIRATSGCDIGTFFLIAIGIVKIPPKWFTKIDKCNRANFWSGVDEPGLSRIERIGRAWLVQKRLGSSTTALNATLLHVDLTVRATLKNMRQKITKKNDSAQDRTGDVLRVKQMP